MFQAQNSETIKQYLKSCCVLQDHYDDERDKIIFYITTPADLQDQDRDRFFWSQSGLVLRPTVSDHITGSNTVRWSGKLCMCFGSFMILLAESYELQFRLL